MQAYHLVCAAIHCFSRKAAGNTDKEIKTRQRTRGAATADACIELARLEHAGLMLSDEQMGTAPPALVRVAAKDVKKATVARATSGWPLWESAQQKPDPVNFEGRSLNMEQMYVVSGSALIEPTNRCLSAVYLMQVLVISDGVYARCIHCTRTYFTCTHLHHY